MVRIPFAETNQRIVTPPPLRGRMGEGRVRKFGIDRYILLYLKWITNKDLLYNSENSAQCYVAAWMGGEFEGEQIHVCV